MTDSFTEKYGTSDVQGRYFTGIIELIVFSTGVKSKGAQSSSIRGGLSMASFAQVN